MEKLTAKKLAKAHRMISVGEVEAIKSIKEFLPEDPIIVNIGAGLGTSALAFLEMAPDAWLTTIDIKQEALQREGAALKDAGIDLTRYASVQSDSIRLGKEWKKPIDVLFVDGRHTYDYVRKEIEVWAPHVKEHGFIFFHDYGKGNPAWEQVKRAVDEWREQEQIDLYKRERIMVAVRIPPWGRHLKRNNLKYYVDLLSNDSPFGFARYGDGEWLTILGDYGGKNSNGCTFTKELSDALREVMRNNNDYEHAMLRIARRKLGTRIGKFLDEGKYEVDWTIGDTFLDISLKGQLWPLIAQLRKKRIVYVGPKHLKRLDTTFFKIVRYVQVPPKNAIKQRDRIVPAILSAIEKHDAEIVGFSSGLHSKVFIDDVWMETNGKVTLIDFGSMWDGYFNVKSRSWVRKGGHDFKKLQEANTKGHTP